MLLDLHFGDRQGIDLIDQLAPLAAATLVLELVGPIVTQRALAAAGESGEPAEG